MARRILRTEDADVSNAVNFTTFHSSPVHPGKRKNAHRLVETQET
jgi:hypothetical protein